MADVAPAPPRREPRVAVPFLLTVVAACAWTGFVLLLSVEIGESGQDLLHLIGGHDAAWWSAVLFAVAAPSTLVLLSRALKLAVGLAAPRHRGAATAVAVTAGVLAGASACSMAAYLVVLASVQPVRVHVAGGSDRVVVTRDPFDGDITTLYARTGRFTYAEEPGPTQVDWRSGPCALSRDASGALVTCGSTAQRVTRERG